MQKLTSLPPLKQLSFLLSIALASLTFSTTFAAFPQQCGNGTGKDPCAQTTQSSAVVGSTSSSGQTSSSAGNPISVITGDKFQLETDYSSSGGVASLRFKRFYSSLNTVRDSGLGQGWRHSFDLALTAKADGSVLQIRQSDGRRVIFNRVNVHSKTYRGVAPQDGIVTRLGDTKPLGYVHKTKK
ncbi:MAG: DUF6531 domain-containing protein [Methylococcaceae bacterium]|nr:DUF6531 domain-containing protein [Methylococcaceae bacterium]